MATHEQARCNVSVSREMDRDMGGRLREIVYLAKVSHVNTVGLQKKQRFEIHCTRPGTSIKRLLH